MSFLSGPTAGLAPCMGALLELPKSPTCPAREVRPAERKATGQE